MTYKESASAAPTEVFYHMPNILFWDAVQFCTVKGQDKKMRGAFEPLDNDHSRNKDNLFSVLEKKYHFLQQMTHPPLFTCVLRRTQGVKALDVHAFVCSSDDEGLGLVRSLHTVHDHYKSDETTETGVFGYRPFSQLAGGGPTMGGGMGEVAAGDGGPGYVPPDGALGGGGYMGGSGGSGYMGGSGGSGYMGGSGGSGYMGGSGGTYSSVHPHSPSSPSPPPPRPAPRPSSLGRHRGGQVQVLPPGAPPVTGQSRLSSHGLSSSMSSLSSASARSTKVYQLTQEDFHRRQAALYLHDDPPPETTGDAEFGQGGRDRERRRAAGSPDSDDGQHVYQYIRHIDNSPVSTLERQHGPPPGRRPDVGSPLRNNRNRNQVITPPGTTTHNNNGSIERDTVARSRALVEETLANQHNSISRNLNHLFGSSSDLGRTPPPSRPTVLGAPYGHSSPTSSLTSPSSREQGRDGRGVAKLGQVYGLSAGSGDPYHDDPSSSAAARSYGGHDPSRGVTSQHMTGSNGSVDQVSIRPAPRPPAALLAPSREDLRPRSSASNHSHNSPFADRRGTTPDLPVRPVAKVPPHKVTGVKVFPVGDAPLASLKSSVQSPDRKPSPFIDGNMGRSQPPRRPTSEYFDEPQYMDESSSSGSSPAKSPPPPASNWAFGKTHDGPGTGKDERKAEDGMVSEKLLLSKKKDAEIASVLQNMRFDYDTTTMSPGLPAGNNFEKSLGYFP